MTSLPEPTDDDVLAALATGLQRCDPPTALRERVLRAGTPLPFTFLDREQGIWLPAPDASVAYREMYHDSRERFSTRLVRVAAGHDLPEAPIDGVRSAVVIEGGLTRGAEALGAGDLFDDAFGSAAWHSEGGALVLELATRDVDGAPAGAIRATSLGWGSMGPGIRARVALAGARELSIVDADAGAVLADHDHGGIEELFVLHGSCEVQGRRMRAGDYHRALPGSHHDITLAGADGCILVNSVRALD
ncbi:MAG: cupin domain-containing protein [Gemmatimonadaceae bacterium]|nr:cupin domain-containing protein [Gemmatimonadaceae bacterium]